jgi:hypothetical protein
LSFKVAIEKMRDDATKWEGVGDATAQAANSAKSFTLAETDLSWASAQTGLLDTYAQIQEHTYRLLDDGTSVIYSLMRALRDAAQAYADSDTDGERRFKGVWDPQPD